MPAWNLTDFLMDRNPTPFPRPPPRHQNVLCKNVECRVCKDLWGPVTHKSRAPRCECTECEGLKGVKEEYVHTTFGDYDNIDPTETKELSDHQYFLCMSHMFGFILKDRTYGKMLCA